jgi:hypothetical protein
MASLSSPVRTLPVNLFYLYLNLWDGIIKFPSADTTCQSVLFIFEAVEHIHTSTGSLLSCLDPFFLISVEVLEGVEEHRLPHK